MRGFWKLTLVELKLMLREPFAAFFTLVFPMMMLFLFGSIYGNTPSSFFGGLGFVDAMVPAYTAMIIATSGMMSLTISMASNREQGILRRYNATPLRPQAVLGAQVIMIFLMTLIGMAFLIVAGTLVYHLRISGNPASMIGGFLLGCLSFFGLGFVLAGLLPTARSAQLVAMALYYPMIFLSGSTIPREVLPPSVQNVAKFLPLTWVVNLLRGLWKGDAWGPHLSDVLCLGAVFVVGVAISAKTFKWD
jgi:ABC-2 type transport system permease protein